MRKVIDIGWCMARIDAKERKLMIVSPAYTDEASYLPSESIEIYGEANLIALRDLLIEAYPLEEKK